MLIIIFYTLLSLLFLIIFPEDYFPKIFSIQIHYVIIYSQGNRQVVYLNVKIVNRFIIKPYEDRPYVIPIQLVMNMNGHLVIFIDIPDVLCFKYMADDKLVSFHASNQQVGPDHISLVWIHLHFICESIDYFG